VHIIVIIFIHAPHNLESKYLPYTPYSRQRHLCKHLCALTSDIH